MEISRPISKSFVGGFVAGTGLRTGQKDSFWVVVSPLSLPYLSLLIIILRQIRRVYLLLSFLYAFG
jgi:hypothetical protein